MMGNHVEKIKLVRIEIIVGDEDACKFLQLLETARVANIREIDT